MKEILFISETSFAEPIMMNEENDYLIYNYKDNESGENITKKLPIEEYLINDKKYLIIKESKLITPERIEYEISNFY
ncbi:MULTISPECIES: hypothetical protein [Proteus]|uniref:Uncharacterized protein n=1 Tax=Proteus faecis TaxID=2050967 RepID=A0AAW7CS47_9GAMM|nr:hypothetical protein [Proteus faecis]MDL5166644.1 hypothetical protein [Proteus faecis]MDL5274721.1 hypothetical protein [Proteus faecis]MDL5278198.1 hypothetical protein [Proteus faecis]MDL5307200.1 hypothetical protein [Proteus faecis]MDL5310756.1 hypothetical protein [Proteus faecis]